MVALFSRVIQVVERNCLVYMLHTELLASGVLQVINDTICCSFVIVRIYYVKLDHIIIRSCGVSSHVEVSFVLFYDVSVSFCEFTCFQFDKNNTLFLSRLLLT